MIIATEEKNGHLLVTIQIAEAGLNNAEAFKTAITQLLDAGEKHMVISFEKVTYIDSSFLGALVSCLKYAIAKQADIALISLQKDIYNLMHLIRIDKVFSIYNSFDEATQKQQ
ncbi:anti-sigma B factor antagonist [Filimonas lacunae]|uniref:Anti-sigma B factor antagonist n=1 Tax=Filimonas lacunae TaxID=477680 RepID=A0A173MS94_9BACT|nr:STAS domain-containing protein [Filimonas lacunae]BAV10238.1 anti-sigma F factor antagonist [Filimonas lacunae]SIT17938.1 anti-sigma B factor antagonist [Filimonas lacunae]